MLLRSFQWRATIKMKDEHMHEQGSQQTQLSAEPMHVTPQKKSLRNFTPFSLSLPDYYTREKKKHDCYR